MNFYTSDGCSYSGMSQETIMALRNELGRETTFVDKATYESIIPS